MKKAKFDIQGMTCSSCSAHIEKAVNKLEGIKKANVNLLSNNMTVEYDEKVLNDNEIIHAVEKEGYGASLHETKKQSNANNRNDSQSPNNNNSHNNNNGQNPNNNNSQSNNNNQNKKENIDQTKENIKSMKHRLIISICFWIPLMYVSMYHMFNEWFGLPIPTLINDLFHGNENAITFGFTQFLLLLPIIYVNRNYFIVGFKKLFKGSPNMDSLIAIGSTAATIYGIFAIYMIGYGLGHNQMELVERYSMDIYFESAGTILTLITVGKYLETKSKGKTSDAISKLINLAPKTATVLRDGKEIELNIEEIVVGDIVIIKPGASIPVDGVIIEGSSAIDQSSITGESIPIEKTVGETIISGTINKNGYLKMKATKVGDDTTLSQIIQLVEEASNSKAPISKIADKVSGVFVPTVIIIAFITIIVWLLAGQSFEFALTMGIAVLVISCPCALGLATPVAIMVGTGKGAEKGILIKSAESLELLHTVDIVVLDKTGTVTEGKPKVTDIVSNIGENELLKIAGSLENNSEHPLAEAIIERVKEQQIKISEVKDFTAISGRGVKGKIDGVNYFGGNVLFMEEKNIELGNLKTKGEEFLNLGKTVLYFANQERVLGIIAVADTIKETSYQAIQELKNRKMEVVMLTGDNKIVAETIGNNLGIDKVVAEVLPQDKEKEVANLQAKGKKVAFVGDGINDSPALVRADVGIAIGSGTDIAIEFADVVLMKNSLLDVVTAIDLSKAVIRNIKMNLFWAFFYNAIGIPIACGVFYPAFGLKLNPMIGAAAMSLSSVCVVANALRLRRFKSSVNENVSTDCEGKCVDSKLQDKNKNVSTKCDDKCRIAEQQDKIENAENEDMKCNGKCTTTQREVKDMNTKTVSIEGMSCNHCKMTVEKALSSIDGVTKVEVSLENKNAVIKSEEEIDDNKIKEVVEEAGYIVKR